MFVKYELPNILDIAAEHNLILSPRSLNKKEISCKCPFCKEDSRAGKESRFYLSLNTEDQVFKCWFCGESGGVFRFIALLTNQHETEVIQRWKNQHQGKVKYKPHPVERLTLTQLRLIGYDKKPNWYEMRKRDSDYYKRTRNIIWQEWKGFLHKELRLAYRELIIGIRFLRYQEAIWRIQEREKKIGTDLLEHVLKIYSLSVRPSWTEWEHTFVEKLLSKEKDSSSETAEQYLYHSYKELVEEIAKLIEVELSEEEVKRLCNIIPELDLDNLEGINLMVLFKIQKGMFDKKSTQLVG